MQFLLYLTLSAPLVALAQLPSDIERITTTASRGTSPEAALPLAISTLSDDTLSLLGTTHIEEALKLVAGAGLQKGNGQEYLPALRSPVFTGAGACGGLLTAEDGIPLRAAGFCNVNELFEAHSEMAARLEVLKGPGSVLYGSNAVHGVINVITPDTTTGTGLAGVDTGSFGYQRARFRAGKDWGEQGIGLNASVTRDNGYRQGESVDLQKINLRHRYDGHLVSVTTGFTYSHLNQHTAGYIEGFESYKDEQLARSNSDPDAYRHARAARLWSRFDAAVANGNLTITPYLRDQNMDFRMHFLPGLPYEYNRQQGLGVQSLWKRPLTGDMHVSLGVDAEYTQGALLQFQNEPTEGSAYLAETVPQGKHYDFTVNASLYAPFAELQWQRNNWLATLGLRYERMHYDYTNRMLDGRTRDDGTECGFDGCRYARPPSAEHRFSNASPKLGISYRFAPQLSAYLNLSKGYRAPQATELYRLQREQQVADLESEQAQNVELGLQGQYRQLRIAVALYRMEKKHVIYRDADFFNVDNGRTRHIGAELELQTPLTKQLDLAMAATLAQHTYQHEPMRADTVITGNDIDTAPRSLANVRLGWKLTHNTRLELEWQHVGRYYTEPQNLHEYEGHDLLALRAAWRLSDGLSLIARINNLTDEAYAERADYTAFGGDRYFPGRPRNLLVSANYQW
ncbi:TonB-dependent receptor [Alteromonas aestuariivivens]|uniref:TonB-dependent receptor n=1 Tax=Alteromonas aestuariivivens TaxID=1938339 RepID=A0A3D8M6A5_9ALTE|nr:TonB-dependent receptor [Alteromonas aestuariivivens]